MDSNFVEFGDCREIMRSWKKEGIKAQTCVTSPPYFGLRDYGHDGQIGLEETPEEYIAAMVEVFRCVWDVLEDDGTLWLNIGDSYARAGGWADNAGLSGTKRGESGRARTNMTGDGNSSQQLAPGYKQKDLLGIPWMLAFALRADGWYLRQDIIWHKPNPMPESVRDRCTKAHEYIFLLSKSQKYYFDSDAMKEPAIYAGDNRGKRNDSRRGTKANSMSGQTGEYRNKRDVWSVTTKPYKGAHFAVFPSDLIEPCVLAGSREGDVVLDPFMGSGTTAMVAKQHGRKYIGCELNESYGALQDERIARALL
jgi:DNA modification methylase